MSSAGSVYSIYILNLLHITNLHLVLRLTVSGATPLLPLHAFVMRRVTLPFYIIIIIIIIITIIIIIEFLTSQLGNIHLSWDM